MKSTKGKVILLVLMINGAVLSATGSQEEYENLLGILLHESVDFLQVDQLKRWQEQGGEFYLFDTRTAPEYEVSHIEGALFLDYNSFTPSKIPSIKKDIPIVIYCSVGYRSEKIGEKFLSAGFTRVYNLYGGIFQWINRGYLVYNDTQEVHQVHGYSREWGRWVRKGKVVYKVTG